MYKNNSYISYKIKQILKIIFMYVVIDLYSLRYFLPLYSLIRIQRTLVSPLTEDPRNYF